MSDNRLFQGRPTAAALSEPSINSEAKIREALEHMGGRRQSPAAASINPTIVNQAARAVGQGPAARHRYVRDGEVQVVHASLGRANPRPDSPSVGSEKAVIETLRQELERERSQRETTERTLQDQKSSFTAMQTRLAHLEMDLSAAQRESAAQELLARDATEARRVAETAYGQAAAKIVQLTERLQVKAAPVFRERTSAVRERAQQPVKWWIKD